MAKPDKEQLRADMMKMARFVRSQTEVSDPQVQETCMDEWTRVVLGEIKVGSCIRNMKRIIANSRSPSIS